MYATSCTRTCVQRPIHPHAATRSEYLFKRDDLQHKYGNNIRGRGVYDASGGSARGSTWRFMVLSITPSSCLSEEGVGEEGGVNAWRHRRIYTHIHTYTHTHTHTHTHTYTHTLTHTHT